ncbi:MAG: PQQ-dependent sugar dehydrogenase [Acidobacteriota bacterium]
MILVCVYLFFAIEACATNKSPVSTQAANRQSNNNQSSDTQADKTEAEETIDSKPLKLAPRKIALGGGKFLSLNVPQGFEITMAADGLKRPRFFAKSPDNRIFLTTMWTRADNSKGAVYILEGFDEKTGRFSRLTPYLENLRNPNSIAFYTDTSGKSWFYIALTDKLIRYRYIEGADAPSSESQVLATFPDYGLNYKYGGWHLTRTLAFDDKGKLFVAVGSSCNACEESEEIRASILEMDADGKNQHIIVRGLRNAVGLKFSKGQLFATNMGQDKLGDDRPEDNFYLIEPNKNYGWPYCYEYKGTRISDPVFAKSAKRVDCREVPLAFVGFPAHSSPLGLEYFPSSKSTDGRLKDSFLVALHGSSKRLLNRGYRLARVRKGSPPQDFLTGFLQGTKVLGRPADVFRLSDNAFLFSDDFNGRVFYVYQKVKEKPAGQK